MIYFVLIAIALTLKKILVTRNLTIAAIKNQFLWRILRYARHRHNLKFYLRFSQLWHKKVDYWVLYSRLLLLVCQYSPNSFWRMYRNCLWPSWKSFRLPHWWWSIWHHRNRHKSIQLGIMDWPTGKRFFIGSARWKRLYFKGELNA